MSYNYGQQGFQNYYQQNPANGPVPSGQVAPPISQNYYDYTLDPTAKQFGLQQGLNAGMVQAGPQLALNADSRDQMAQQIAAYQASQLAQSGYLNQDYQTGLAKLGLQDQSLDVQREALARQPGYLGTLHDLANQAYNQQAATNLRGLNSQATAAGSYTSIGAGEGRNDIATQLANQLSRSDTQYNEQLATVADQNKMLDLQAQNLGLDRTQLKTDLDRGLDRLGLSTTLSVSDLLTKLNSSNIEDQMLAQQIFNAALGSSDYYSQFYNPQTTNLQSIYGPTDTSGNIKQGAKGPQ